jgi:hypothetical protein
MDSMFGSPGSRSGRTIVDRKISQRIRRAYASALLREPTLLSELLRSELLVVKRFDSTGTNSCHGGMAGLC